MVKSRDLIFRQLRSPIGALGTPEARQLQRSMLVANAQRSGLVGVTDVSDAMRQRMPRQ